MNLCTLLLCLGLSADDPPRDRWLAEDKWKHLVTSFVVTSLSASAARTVGLDDQASLVAGASAGIGAGVWKEIRDEGEEGNAASFRDLVWDAAGIAAAVVIAAQSR